MVVAKEISNLYNRYCEDKLSHAFLLETNNLDKCYKDVLELIKLLNGANETNNLANLIDNLNLPSLIVIEPDGMSIKKTQVLDLQDRFATKPLYSIFNTYIINKCDRLNIAAANTMLKFLEEPTENIIGFFITTNKESVLDTIKSRCQIISVNYEETCDNFIDQNFITYFIDNIKDEYDSVFIKRKEFMNNFGDRKLLEENFSQLLNLITKYIKDYLNHNDLAEYSDIIFKKVDINNLIILTDKIKNILLMLRNNVNIDLILDSLYFEVRDIYD